MHTCIAARLCLGIGFYYHAMKFFHLLLYYCISALSLASVDAAELGQTERAVIQQNGKPSSVMELGRKKILLYPDQRIELLDGKVVQMGAKVKADTPSPTVRASSSGKLKTIPSHLRKVHTHLINSSGQKVQATSLAETDYTLFYFSAAWCPPCRKFTPKLVDFYNLKRTHNNFEIIFVSADRDAKAMIRYMQTYKMPWPAIKFDQIQASQANRYAGSGIPCLVLFDANGKVIADSYLNGRYVGPIQVLEELDKRL